MGFPRPSAPVRQPSPQKASAILQGAMSEFLQQGYAATSMDRIARTAGVSKATVYSHFTSKESLFEVLTRDMVHDHFAELFGEDVVEAIPADPRLALRRLASRMLDQHNGDPRFLSFLRLVIGESGRFPALARGFITQVYQRAFQDVRDLFCRCTTAAGADPDLLAQVFIGALVHQVLCQDLLHGREEIPLDRQAFADGLLDLLCGEAEPHAQSSQ